MIVQVHIELHHVAVPAESILFPNAISLIELVFI